MTFRRGFRIVRFFALMVAGVLVCTWIGAVIFFLMVQQKHATLSLGFVIGSLASFSSALLLFLVRASLFNEGGGAKEANPAGQIRDNLRKDKKMDFWSVAEIVWLTAAFSGVLVAAPKYAENWVEQLQGLREDIGAHYEQQFLDLIDQYHRSAKGWYQEVRCDSPGATIFQPTCDFLGNFLKFAERIENEPGYLASEFAKNPKMPWDYWHEVESLKDVQVAQNDLLAMLTNWERVGIHSPYRASRMINRMRETLNKHHIGPDEKRDYALHISGCDESTGGEVCDTVGSALSTTEFYEVQDVPSLSRLLNRLNASVAVGDAFLSREPSSFRDRYVDAEPGLEDFYRSRPQADFDLSLPPVSAVELVPFAARTDLEQPKGLEAKMIWVWRIGAFAPLLLGAAFGVRYAKALAAF